MTDAQLTSTTAMLDWLGATGAASASELAAVAALSSRTVLTRLRALEHAGLVSSAELLRGEPPLHTLTRRGLRAAGRPELDPISISASSFGHFLAVARVAVALRAAGESVGGERELRAFERIEGRPLASAAVGLARDGATAWHRPDLVCWRAGAPLAIEVELTVKAPERLRTIVRGWARSRLVEGVVYYATTPAARALRAAVRIESAQEAVAILALERAGELPAFHATSSNPSGA
jgi:DNA-binding transcriptional ArsR family regulator